MICVFFFSLSVVAMYREPSLHNIVGQSLPRKTAKTSDCPVNNDDKKDPLPPKTSAS